MKTEILLGEGYSVEEGEHAEPSLLTCKPKGGLPCCWGGDVMETCQAVVAQLRASGTFLVTSQLGQPLEIDALIWKRMWSTFASSFKGCLGRGSGELQICLLLLLGCVVHEYESRCELAPFAPQAVG